MALGVLMERNNTVKQAGGFIIQLMPFAQEDVIRRLEEKIASLRSVTQMLEEGNTPEQILTLLLGDMGVEFTEKMPVQFVCSCTKERVEKVLISLGKEELQNMIEEGREVELHCHFCNTNYVFTVEELKRLPARLLHCIVPFHQNAQRHTGRHLFRSCKVIGQIIPDLPCLQRHLGRIRVF